MKPTFICAAVILMVGVCPAFAQTPPAPVRLISTITDGFHAKYNTIAHALLNDEAPASDVTQNMYDFIDAVIDEAKVRITKKPPYTRDEAISMLRTIDEILVGKNVVYPAQLDGMGLVDQLSDGLRGRVMNPTEIDALAKYSHNERRSDRIRQHASEPFYVNDCDTTSFLYLAIAEVIDLPLYLIELPGHNFIRYEDGTTSFDWETMDARVAPPKYYQQTWRIPQDLIANRVYLASMNRADVVGYHFTITAEVWAKKHVDRRAFDDDLKAVSLYPRGPRVWNQIAWHVLTAADPNLRNGQFALENSLKAVAISRTPNLLDTLACAYAQTKQFDIAIEIENEARYLDQTGDFPAEIEKPNFAQQIGLFQQHRTCAESPSIAVVSVSKMAPSSLSDLVHLRE